ncbi:MAG TPA: hypothetical protein VIU02_09935 [Burkholderiales bacterium]
MTGAERVRRYRLRRGVTKVTKRDSDAEDIGALKAELAAARQMGSALRETISILREALEATRNELRSRDRFSTATGSGRGMSVAAHRTIMKALHPDYTPSEADRAEACKAFNNLVKDHKPARR